MIYTYTYIHTYKETNIYIHSSSLIIWDKDEERQHADKDIHTYIHTYIDRYIGQTHLFTHIHTHVYTYIHSSSAYVH